MDAATLSSVSPAEIDLAWLEALAHVFRLYEQANAASASAARYRKFGGYEKQADRYAQQAYETQQRANELRADVDTPFKIEWDARGGWTRAYLVPDGHIHRSTACHSLHPTTIVSWLPELSGHGEDEIVAAAGMMACTICYPTAPVEALRAADRAKKAEGECPGSRTWDHDSSGLMYYSPRARCNHCRQTVSATSTGKLRAHKKAAA